MTVNDLEDKIMSVWGTADDIDTFLYRYLDSPAGELSEDDISNTLLGIKTLHDQRCQKLWDAFEEVIKSNRDYKGISSGMPLEGTAAISSPTAAEFITLNHSSAESLLQADREAAAVRLLDQLADREPLESEI